MRISFASASMLQKFDSRSISDLSGSGDAMSGRLKADKIVILSVMTYRTNNHHILQDFTELSKKIRNEYTTSKLI
jgi:hypothetical protein